MAGLLSYEMEDPEELRKQQAVNSFTSAVPPEPSNTIMGDGTIYGWMGDKYNALKGIADRNLGIWGNRATNLAASPLGPEFDPRNYKDKDGKFNQSAYQQGALNTFAGLLPTPEPGMGGPTPAAAAASSRAAARGATAAMDNPNIMYALGTQGPNTQTLKDNHTIHDPDETVIGKDLNLSDSYIARVRAAEASGDKEALQALKDSYYAMIAKITDNGRITAPYDKDTQRHVDNTHTLSRYLADITGLPAGSVRTDIGRAALSHDVGKTITPQNLIDFETYQANKHGISIPEMKRVLDEAGWRGKNLNMLSVADRDIYNKVAMPETFGELMGKGHQKLGEMVGNAHGYDPVQIDGILGHHNAGTYQGTSAYGGLLSNYVGMADYLEARTGIPRSYQKQTSTVPEALKGLDEFTNSRSQGFDPATHQVVKDALTTPEEQKRLQMLVNVMKR